MPTTAVLSELTSFSIENGSDDAHKKITFNFDDPDKQYENLMMVFFPFTPPLDVIERAMTYDIQTQKWSVEIEKANDTHEPFRIIKNVTPQDELPTKQAAATLESGFIALRNGVQQSELNINPDNPAGVLKKFLYTKDGKIAEEVPDNQLKEGERLITIYFPPGYDANRKQPYNFQVTLDGRQYLEHMNMHVIFDNLIASGEIEPVVNVFISAYKGAPDPLKPGLLPVTPPGYSLSQRLQEYSCNPEFAHQLAQLPETMHEQFNVTKDPKHTTIWGLSMGGLQAEYTALTYPDVFGNVVAQSPMAWNIPRHLSDNNWREQITDNWETSTAPLPPLQEHKEYLTQTVLSPEQIDIISGRSIAQSETQQLKFYFDAGEAEKEYNPETGNANLVESTGLFSEALQQKGHIVVDSVVTPGGHDAMTWIVSIPDAAKAMHQPVAELAHGAEVNVTQAHGTSPLTSPTSFFGKSFAQALQGPQPGVTIHKEDDKKHGL